MNGLLCRPVNSMKFYNIFGNKLKFHIFNPFFETAKKYFPIFLACQIMKMCVIILYNYCNHTTLYGTITDHGGTRHRYSSSFFFASHPFYTKKTWGKTWGTKTHPRHFWGMFLNLLYIPLYTKKPHVKTHEKTHTPTVVFWVCFRDLAYRKQHGV